MEAEDSRESGNAVLVTWNLLATEDAVNEILPCCSSAEWAKGVARERPYTSVERLLILADEVWWSLGEKDWLEAFAAHPRIGERADGSGERGVRFEEWSSQEQSQALTAAASVQRAIAEGNRTYDRRFGFTYIVCAMGKSAEEMLDILNRRLRNEPATEMREAAEQQRQITQVRLRKWLSIAAPMRSGARYL